jgi:hypothetical protein
VAFEVEEGEEFPWNNACISTTFRFVLAGAAFLGSVGPAILEVAEALLALSDVVVAEVDAPAFGAGSAWIEPNDLTLSTC